MQDVIAQVEDEFRRNHDALRAALAAATTRGGEAMIAAQREIVRAAEAALDDMQTAFAEFQAGQAALISAAETAFESRKRGFFGGGAPAAEAVEETAA